MGIKATVLIILTIIYLYELALHLLRMRSAGNPVPANVSDVYDPETYRKWKQYHGEKTRLGVMTSTVSWLIHMVLMALNAYAAFAGLFPQNPSMQMVAVLLLASLTDLLLLPFSWYDTMHIEEKYGFNRSSKKTFWADQLKSFVISLILMIGIGCLLTAAHCALGDWMTLAFAGAMTLVVLLISFLYPVLSKVFNKFTPLEDGELKDRLTALLEKHGYKVRGIKVMDASRRTTKSNAAFAGFGKIPELYGKLRMLPACRATAVAMLRSPQTLKTIYGDTADWPHLTEECFETKVLLGGLDTFSMNWLSMHHLADVPANLRPFIMISNPVAAVLTPEAVYIDAKYRAADHPNKDEAAWCREL